jgi:cation diffusion facilitator CzcD-associated flavoprotein CzcO
MSASEQSATKEISAHAASPMPRRHVETVIIGTGFSGLLAAIRRRGGRSDRLYCISFIPYPFRKTFSPQSELLAYTNHIIDRFGLQSMHVRTRR